MPFFSVVIPLYNKEHYIENTLWSVLDQTYTDFEVIIVDDGSTDDSLKRVRSFTDSRIRIIPHQNQGASITRNTGIHHAAADFIAFLDADDIWQPNHLSVLKKLIDDFPGAGIYASRYELIFKNKHRYIPSFKGISSNYRGLVPDYFESSMQYAVATSSSIAVPKSVFTKVGNFKPYISSGQDNDMWLRIALKYPVAVGNEVTASYLHFIQDSLSKTSILEKKIKRFEEYREEENQNNSLKKYLDLYRMEYALQYKIAGDLTKSKQLFTEILPENISWKSRMLYKMPRLLLLELLRFKRFLRSLGIDFSVYQ
ncbi:hypothetical protein FEDK69T_24400 [Flavobacterium enshiense DK69]|uniref:Glycosyltransferase 2-like domain-containing protein n=1 Tax=Flavobacterium enshiense DK69 TaxID=1107311 RepID=V6S712_9FLAO|nr:glycosyltransferase family A protein [Flavobacterium enshiense]ESU22446.1 hypothetical protein FEDK69T_24400 [Flavobacterium enshiense DK69]KGO97449.1 hypothetical protein Q767_02315 [Flavobacterium enshiense DK69]